MAGKNPDEIELREMLMRYRLLREETSDPIAMRFLHDIVVGLEAELDHLRSPSSKTLVETKSSRPPRSVPPTRQRS
jgi:hypothetical protein